MTWASSKGNQLVMSHPRNISWIAVSVGGLALFLILGCMILVGNPFAPAARGFSVDSSNQLYIESPDSKLPRVVDSVDSSLVPASPSSDLGGADGAFPSETSLRQTETDAEEKDSKDDVVIPVVSTGSLTDDNVDVTGEGISGESNVKVKVASTSHSEREKDGVEDQSGDVVETKYVSSASFDLDSGDKSPSSTSRSDSGCDLYQGTWIYDSLGPLYSNNTCPVLTQMQNCQGNGRPDKDYENWRWKPEKCELPRFNARKFLELMRDKTIAFIGDSVARNQMESLLCILWQEEVPRNRGNRKMQRYYFKSTSTMIIRMWSSWLVKQTTEPENLAPGVTKLHLDFPDDNIMAHLQKFDVIVLSSGHWFAKQSVYLLNNETVGGQLWWPDKSKPMKVNNVEAFGISVETILTYLGTDPSYKGLVIVRSYSPDHYEGGAWNTGGSCTGKTKPLAPGEVVENDFTNIMHKKQVTGFERAIKKKNNKSSLRLMDITRVFEYRHDGHPGPYRSTDPNKLTQRGPDGKPPPQDCLHWCMPGPVDTWNELVFELIRREYEDNVSFS